MFSGHISFYFCILMLFIGCSGTSLGDDIREQPYFQGRIAVGGASGMAMADFNEDGKVDMAVTKGEGDTIRIYINQGPGWFKQAPALDAQTNPHALAVGDFNNDSHIDLVSSNYGSFSVSFFPGDGTGNFGEPIHYSPYSQVGQIEVADFNNDGNLDFMTCNSGTRDLSLFLGDGLGGFTSHIALSGFSLTPRFSLADFNCDGKMDVAVKQRVDVRIFYNEGGGVFGKSVIIRVVENPYQSKSLDTGDLNSDGYPDIAVGILYSDTQDFAVVLSRNDGTFDPVITYQTPCEIEDVHFSDVNQDGFLDLALLSPNCSERPNKILTYLGNGQGDLVAGPVSIGVDGLTGHILTADMNGDGFIDVIYQDRTSVNTVISFGLGDGSFFSEQLLPRMGNGYCNPYVSDVDHDGIPDITVIDRHEFVVFPGPAYEGSIISPFTHNNYPYRLLRIGDCTGDNLADAVIGGDWGLAVYRGNTDMTFTFDNDPQAGFPEECEPLDMLLEDFDGNGTLDLITTCEHHDYMSLFSGIGDGHFQKVEDIAIVDPFGITSGYYNNDSIKDIATGSGGGPDAVIKIYTGVDGPGIEFQLKSTLNLNGDYCPISMVSRDITRDGTVDLVWTDGEFIFTAAGLGDGTFSPDFIVTRTGNTQWSVQLLDFNGDGLDDIALANYDGRVTTMLGTGDGSFYEMVTYYGEGKPDSLAVQDLNNDGLEDIVVGNKYFITILYASQSGQQTMADLSKIGIAVIIVLISLLFLV